MPPKKTIKTTPSSRPMRETNTVSTARRSSSDSAKHAFFYLTSFATLALTATSLGTLVFQIINYFFPEEFDYYSFDFSQWPLKFAISTILIAAPIFYFTTRVINRSISQKDLDTDSGVRKWLTYIVLFVALGTVVGDLISIVNSFLGGELTVRFILKALTILVIAGGIFAYYFTDIKNEDEQSRREKNNTWSAVFWALVLIPFVGSFFLMESPMETRMKRIDNDTVLELESIRSALNVFYDQEGRLPRELSEVESPQYGFALSDNIREKGIQYKPGEGKNYQLCAEFERDNRNDPQERYYYETSWKHSAGNFCFELEALDENSGRMYRETFGSPVLEPVTAPPAGL